MTQCISVYILICGEVMSEKETTQAALVGQERTNPALMFLSDVEDESSLV